MIIFYDHDGCDKKPQSHDMFKGSSSFTFGSASSSMHLCASRRQTKTNCMEVMYVREQAAVAVYLSWSQCLVPAGSRCGSSPSMRASSGGRGLSPPCLDRDPAAPPCECLPPLCPLPLPRQSVQAGSHLTLTYSPKLCCWANSPFLTNQWTPPNAFPPSLLPAVL